jgi:predicted PurR-regulated permease PerM
MSLLRALMLLTIGMILTVYLLIEWKRTMEWLIAFVPKSHRSKVRLTLYEARVIMFGYVAGNVATSIFAAIFVFVALTILKVPAALLLALLAGVFDFVPVLGFALSGVPAVVLASTVSPATAVLVVGLYILYHFIENYFIAPKVYGTELRLSNLAVLISFAVGAELGGVIGALLALPFAAAYPAVERIWLSERLESDTVEKHQTLEHAQPPG